MLVVTPDLDAAAPLIDAIFGTTPKERALPYTLCGGARSRVNAPARCLLQLLALASSRCTATELFALLQQGLVARRFGLDAQALAQVHAWLLDAGFHWALDAPHRASFELPATPRHTLADALQRLFLGYALPEQQDAAFDGLLGAGNAEGSRALALGALWRFAQALQRAHADLQQPRPPEAWAALLSALLDEFLAADDAALDDLRELRQTLHQLVDDMLGGGVAEPLPLAVVRAALQARLDDPARGGAAGGSINFASMSSLRGLPFAVVCAIGLNDGAFPGTGRPLEFDLMARQPRRGDRKRRDDDRGLMLDLLLGARHSLYLSHTGRSVRDNTPLPPSVLVAELLDLLVPAIAADPASAASLAAARAQLVVEHPLQPFALQSFDASGDARLRSYDRELAEALRGSLQAQPAPPQAPAAAAEDDAEGEEDAGAAPRQPFFRAALATPGPEWRQVSLAQLQEFFRNPCRALLRRRLGIELARDEAELLDDEPFLPDARSRSALADRLLPLLLQGTPAEALPALARAGTELPEGTLGEAQLQRELQSLQAFADTLREALAEPPLPPQTHSLQFVLDGEPWQLQWSFADLRPSGLLRWRYAPTRAGDRMAAWLQHLALCAARPDGVAARTRWLSSDGEFSLAACDDAAAQLQQLLALYRPRPERTASLLSTHVLGVPARWLRRGACRLAVVAQLGRRRRPGLPAGAARRRRRAGRALRSAGPRRLRAAAGRAAGRTRMKPNPPAFDVFGCPLQGTRLIEASAGTGKTWTLCGLVPAAAAGTWRCRCPTSWWSPSPTPPPPSCASASAHASPTRWRGCAARARSRPTPSSIRCWSNLREQHGHARRGHGAAPGPGAAELRRGLDPDHPRLLPACTGRSAVQHRHAAAADAAGRRQRAAPAGGARLLAPPHRRGRAVSGAGAAPARPAGHAAATGRRAAAAPGQAAVALAVARRAGCAHCRARHRRARYRLRCRAPALADAARGHRRHRARGCSRG